MASASDILIVEDEMIIAEAIADILRNAGYNNIRITDSTENALKEIEKSKPSLVLTDINLGVGRTGIDLGRLLESRFKVPFIYITSYSSAEVISKAKHTRPSAYIIKPFKNEDLLVAMEFALFNSNHKFANICDEHVLILKEGRAVTTLCLANIMWVESTGNQTTINTSNGRKRTLRHPLSEIESQLSRKPFMKIHDQYLVNCSYITETGTNTIFVSGAELPVGKNYQKAVLSYFNC